MSPPLAPRPRPLCVRRAVRLRDGVRAGAAGAGDCRPGAGLGAEEAQGQGVRPHHQPGGRLPWSGGARRAAGRARRVRHPGADRGRSSPRSRFATGLDLSMTGSAGAIRTILHVDMDAFYASVEQRDRPELRGLPVIVGADPRGRGVVSAASYEARRFGVHSAMPISRAARLCPDGVFLPVDMDKYARVSRQIMAVLAEFTPLLEPLSIDEAFLDVTATRALFGDGGEQARRIKTRIRDTVDLTASVGVASNKFVAKVASDLRKPDGLVMVL